MGITSRLILTLTVIITALSIGSLASPASAALAKSKAGTIATVKWSPNVLTIGERGWVKAAAGARCKNRDVVIEQKTQAGWATVLDTNLGKVPTFEFTFQPQVEGAYSYRVKLEAVKNCARKVSKHTVLALSN